MFEFDGQELHSEFTPLDQHEGYPGIVHGGVISSLLYEVMASGATLAMRRCCVSTVEFRGPVPAGRAVTCDGEGD